MFCSMFCMCYGCDWVWLLRVVIVYVAVRVNVCWWCGVVCVVGCTIVLRVVLLLCYVMLCCGWCCWDCFMWCVL